MILQHELKPESYTIDADFLNGSNCLTHLQADPSEMIVNSCEQYGFAVVRNVLSTADFENVRNESREVLRHHDESGWTQQIESMTVTRVDKTRERSTELPPLSQQLIGEFAMRLWKASNEGDRLHTPDTTIGTAYVMRQLYGSHIGKHRDSVSGVMCELSLQGKAVMRFRDNRRRLATAVLRPNDMVVMPAETTANREANRRPIKHSIINTTAKRDGGQRLALVYNYGRSPLAT